MMAVADFIRKSIPQLDHNKPFKDQLDSLGLTQLLMRVEKEYSLRFSPTELFSVGGLTPHGFAARVERILSEKEPR